MATETTHVELFEWAEDNGNIDISDVVAIRYEQMMEGNITEKVTDQNQILDIMTNRNSDYWVFFDKYGNAYNKISGIGYNNKI